MMHFLRGLWSVMFSVSLGVAAYAGAKEPAIEQFPLLEYENTWIGNSFGGRDGLWVAYDASDLVVSENGTVFTNVLWEEGGRQAGIYRDGRVTGQMKDTHGWGRTGGDGVAVGGGYVFITQTQSGDDGADDKKNAKGKPRYPAAGTVWYVVGRYFENGEPAPFYDGFGIHGNYALVERGIGGRKKQIPGLALSGDKLFVADRSNGLMKVFDPGSMRFHREWKLEDAGRLTAGSDGRVWNLAGRSSAVEYHPDGSKTGRVVTFPSEMEPMGFCLAPDGRLWVTDSGPDQDIKIYDLSDLSDSPTRIAGRFGVRGGVYAGVPGRVEPGELVFPMGVGFDRSGRVYVGQNRSTDHFVLEAFEPDGRSLWRLEGLEFIDVADLDPQDESKIWTKHERFSAISPVGNGPSARWEAYLVDPFRFPNDPRVQLFGTMPTGTWVRMHAGQRYVFLTDMYAHMLRVFRFSPETHGEIAIPTGLFGKQRTPDDKVWPPHAPETEEWIWRDQNGNGQFDPGEYRVRDGKPSPARWGWHVDDALDVWQATNVEGIRRFRFQEPDDGQVAGWDYDHMETYPMPAPFTRLQRIIYDREADVLFLGGYTKDLPYQEKTWGQVGPVLARYDRWLAGAPSEPTWVIRVPWDGNRLLSRSVAFAGDYLFVVTQYEAEVFVYRASDGAPVGRMIPNEATGRRSGWVDIPYGLTARRLKSGEYLVFVEENGYAKVMMYRWKPPTPPTLNPTSESP